MNEIYRWSINVYQKLECINTVGAHKLEIYYDKKWGDNGNKNKMPPSSYFQTNGVKILLVVKKQ